MHDVIKDLLLNLFFLTFLPLLIISTWSEKFVHLSKKMKILLINMTAIIASILCMSFPVYLGEDFIFDLRQIPLILVTLFLGYKNSILLIIATLIYRFILGGDGFQAYLIVLFTIYMTVPLLKNMYVTSTLTKKIMINSFLAAFFGSYTLLIAKLLSPIPLQFGDIAYYYIGLQLIGMIVITIMLQYIEENFKVKKEILKSEKLKALGELPATVSHELKNPLTVTKGFIQLINEHNFSDKDKQRYLSLALTELNRAKDIIDNYLVFANTFPDEIEKMSIRDEIFKVIDFIEHELDVNEITIQVNCPERTFFEGERKKFHQVLVNIIKNSIHAMPDGGLMIIDVKEQKGFLTILIQDNGEGMTEEEVSLLGEPVFNHSTEGTGLGLMVVFQIIQSFGGTIEISSKLNVGTDVTVKLPMQDHLHR